MPSIRRDVRLGRHAGGEHELLGPQHDLLAVAVDDHGPLVAVEGRRAHGRGAPVVELHHPRVHLQPVADLVLGREDGPVLGELDVRQVVVPDRVVQAERLVALAPGVTGALVALDDDRRDVELAQPRSEPDAALAAADDHDVGLLGVAELGGLALAPLEPRQPVARGAVVDALRPPRARRLLVALELVERGQEASRPCRCPHAGAGTLGRARGGLELEPGVGHAVGRARRLADPSSRSAARSPASRRACPARPPGPSTVLMFHVNATRSRQ